MRFVDQSVHSSTSIAKLIFNSLCHQAIITRKKRRYYQTNYTQRNGEMICAQCKNKKFIASIDFFPLSFFFFSSRILAKIRTARWKSKIFSKKSSLIKTGLRIILFFSALRRARRNTIDVDLSFPSFPVIRIIELNFSWNFSTMIENIDRN